jgi:hypothetical protein
MTANIGLTTAFGPDNQPYFAGQSAVNKTVNTFNGKLSSGRPGGTSAGAWPQCITQGTSLTIAQAFAAKSGHCGLAEPNAGFPTALLSQVPSLISHGSYMYVGILGGPVLQTKVTVDPTSGLSQYSPLRTFLSGAAIITGLGVADDLTYAGGNGEGSLMVFSDPSNVALAAQEVVTKLPLCEDIP